MKTMNRAALIAATCVFLLPLAAQAEIRAGSVELSPFVGYNIFENDQNLEDEWLLGGRIGYNFNQHFGLEGVVEYMSTNVDDRSITSTEEGQYGGSMDSVDLTFYHLDAVYHFMPDEKFNPFVVAGFGGAHYSPEIADGDMAAFNFGVGAKYSLTENIAIRVDLRDYMVTEVFQETYHNFGATVGLTFAFGGKANPAPERVVKREPKAAPAAEEPVVILASEPKVKERVQAVAAKAKVVVLALDDIHFNFDKATLKPEAKVILKENIQLLKKNRKAQIRIAGYTSALGAADYNKSLSARRAKAVEDYLIEEGLVAPDRLSTIGYGEANADVYEAAPKELYSPAAKANMRVEFEIIVK
jgi:OOP family OmpA-OmpF porin